MGRRVCTGSVFLSRLVTRRTSILLRSGASLITILFDDPAVVRGFHRRPGHEVLGTCRPVLHKGGATGYGDSVGGAVNMLSGSGGRYERGAPNGLLSLLGAGRKPDSVLRAANSHQSDNRAVQRFQTLSVSGISSQHASKIMQCPETSLIRPAEYSNISVTLQILSLVA